MYKLLRTHFISRVSPYDDEPSIRSSIQGEDNHIGVEALTLLLSAVMVVTQSNSKLLCTLPIIQEIVE
jgi:hypothetical protein